MEFLDSKCGTGWKYSYTITKVDDIKGSDFLEVKKKFEDINVKVSAAKDVKLEIKFKGDKGTDFTDKTIRLIKIGRSWYLGAYNMRDLF